MTRRTRPLRMVSGLVELRSPLMSNHWRVLNHGAEIARLRRFPHHRMSAVRLDDGTEWRLEPFGWGVVRATEDGEEFARIVRRSWWGRRWDLDSTSFSLHLVSRPAPRRWDFTVGTEPVARLAGSPLSYNRLRVQADLALPLIAVLLAWQVVCRPWEAAAYPLALRPAPQAATVAPTRREALAP